MKILNFVTPKHTISSSSLDQSGAARVKSYNFPCSILLYRVFSHDVTAAILVSQNNETAAMLVSQTSPLGVELFSHANAFFCSNKFA